ncbi:hypothetical protein HPB50_005458 [Hyalomma asiaticum]|uniref:Uncharacterized protein n=1 Tax=Hyalomma asiaticum TaxID=266040 RepID=A0ACB7SVC0_HYAAI|nr:hypothetical protein HPB50_005458 [Hyalomma asiaticum]
MCTDLFTSIVSHCRPSSFGLELLKLPDVKKSLDTCALLPGGSMSDLGPLDGKEMWAVMSRDEPSQRSDVVYNIDPLWDYAAIRRGSFKIVVGSHAGGRFDQRFPIPGGQGTSRNLDGLMEASLAAKVSFSLSR